MFKKALVVEDLDSILETVVQTLKKLNIVTIHSSKYCDEALIKIKKAQIENEPYDLLISDLSFKQDHRDNKINNGEELIALTKKTQPNIKAIVFSIEDKSFKINSLFDNHQLDAYVIKGRNSLRELEKAIFEINQNKTGLLFPKNSNISSKKSELIEIETYDITLLTLLSKGHMITEIANEFRLAGIQPNGNSSIEKRINKLKIYFKANNNVHLIAITKDLGLI